MAKGDYENDWRYGGQTGKSDKDKDKNIGPEVPRDPKDYGKPGYANRPKSVPGDNLEIITEQKRQRGISGRLHNETPHYGRGLHMRFGG